MPQGGGTGPNGQGPTGGGMGRGRGGGRGRMGGRGVGPGGNCICPKCGTRKAHQRGQPCMNRQCPNCGSRMTRE